MKSKTRRKESGTSRKRSYGCLTSTLRKLQSLTTFLAPTRSGAIGTRSRNSLTGIALSRACHSARLWWSDTRCIWNRDISRPVQSMSALELCVASRTNLPTAGFGARIRVSAWSRGERSRPACGHSVSGGQPNDDENRVFLLAAAVHDGHSRTWIYRKTRGPSVRGRARVVSRRRRVACGAAS